MSKSIAACSRSLLPWLASFAVASGGACASPPAPPPLAATAAAPSVVTAPQAVALAPFENHGGMWARDQRCSDCLRASGEHRQFRRRNRQLALAQAVRRRRVLPCLRRQRWHAGQRLGAFALRRPRVRRR